MPFFAKDQWVDLFGFRYLLDTGVQSAFEGNTTFFSVTFARIGAQ